MLWFAILAAAGCSYALKLAGLSVPRRMLEDQRTQKVAELLPVALLAALVATGTMSTRHHVGLDARAAGVICAAIAVWRRAPFLLVVVLAAAVTALVRVGT